MPCYHPLKAFQKPGEKKLTFCNQSNGLFDLWKHANEKFDPQIFLQYGTALRIPCGQCVGCRMTYSREWAVRCCLESLYYEKDSCWFVTLTYDDEHVPLSFAHDVDTGEVTFQTQTLVKKHFQDFMKRFRKNLHDNYGVAKIRFFACGEYGSLSKRPHYHFIVFGLPYSSDYFSPCKCQNSGHIMYDVKPVMESWKFGFCPVEDMTFDSAAYVAGYMLKKVKGKEAQIYYDSHGILPEFSLMSRKPGLGSDYFDEYADDIYLRDSLCRRFGNMDFTPRPPKYFDVRFSAQHPEEMALLKLERRKSAKDSLKSLLDELGISEEQYLASEEERIKLSCKMRSKKV